MFNRIFSLIVVLIFLIGSLSLAQNSRRDRTQQPVRIMDSVDVHEGMIIGEAGAGRGYLTFHLAKRVGNNGHIYANDIDEDVLDVISDKCKKDSITNITTIIGQVDDPLFPEGKLDMVVILRAFHDFTKPVQWMKNVIPALKPDGTLVIIDPDPDKLGKSYDHFYTKQKVFNLMKKTDFNLVKVLNFHKEDNIYIYKIN